MFYALCLLWRGAKVCNGWQKKHWQAKIVTWKLATFCKTKPNLRGTHLFFGNDWITVSFKIWFNVNESTSTFFPTWKHYLESNVFMLQLCKVTKYALFGQQNQQKFQKACTSLQWLQKDMIHPCKHALCHTKKQNVQRGIPGIVRGMWPKHWLKLEISSKQFLRLQSCIEKNMKKNLKACHLDLLAYSI